ncbi:MAG: LysR family transcriptional regulator [Paracoccaceae bacterium]
MSYFDNIKTFIRVYELGSMSAAARDQRISPAVASARISQLEEHLSVRLFQRTTRMLHPTEQGKLFYSGATRVLEAVEDAEAAVQDITQNPRGTLYVAAPLGIGRRLIAPAIPMFKQQFPLIDIRLRLSDRRVDVLAEGLDLAFFLGNPEDSTLKMRKFATCARLLCAAPEYLAARGLPKNVAALTDGSHDCLNLRFPGASEFQWPLKIDGKIQRIAVKGPYESDDGDVLTNWALEGHGIVLKPLFEVQEHLNIGRLVPVLTDVTPTEVQLGCLYPHRKRQDPKTRHFMDFMAQHITVALQK